MKFVTIKHLNKSQILEVLLVCTPGPVAQPSDALALPHCLNWGCFHSLHSHCWARSQRWRKMRTRRMKKKRKRMLGGQSLTWLCDPYVVHLASWQNGTQTHPVVRKKRKGKKKLNQSECLRRRIRQLYSPAASVPCPQHHGQVGCTCSSWKTSVEHH